ncbi:MAG TPA: PAS domain S-box protein [Spirochaetota bacterium]|nr:PAS domain S-box protein [Spirochaetota bacterium]HPI91332.1 PAS domain S-box protein [Spirochaetota bacterium]HPR49904.1 PAS domain S-box protein [Spirochaetota bacterium]
MNKNYRTILIVENEAVIALNQAETVKSFGYQVMIANSGEQALDFIENSNDIGLVLMDIDLGKGMDGPQTAREILARRDIPIVFLTSHAEREIVEKVRGITRYGYVIKNSGDFVLQSSIEMAYDLFDANNKLSFHHGLSQMLNSCADLQQGLDIVLKSVMSLEHIDCGGIYVADPLTGNFNMIVHYGLSEDFVALVSYYDADSPAIRAASAGKVRYGSCGDFPQMPVDVLIDEKLQCIASIPIMVQEKLIAILNLGSRSTDDFPHATRIALETLASSIGSAVIRLQSDAALRLSEKKYRQLFTHAPAGILEVDFINQRFIKVNSLICEYTGFTEAEMLSMNPLDILTEESKIRFARRLNDMATGQPVSKKVELEIKEKNGHARWVELNNDFIRQEGKITGSTVVIHDITERKYADQKIRALLVEKDILLKEVHHRIKNNMITMISLLSLQARRMKNAAASDALNDAGNRLRSMQVLYDKLYRSEFFQDMPISSYLPSLVDEIKSSFPESGFLEIVKEIDDFMISAELLPPLGMIINELLTNAIKHAFAGLDAGTIKVTASMRGNQATIALEDNGIGMPESVDIENTSGFGLWLVNTLIKQIGGMIRIERNPGTRFIIIFDV